MHWRLQTLLFSYWALALYFLFYKHSILIAVCLSFVPFAIFLKYKPITRILQLGLFGSIIGIWIPAIQYVETVRLITKEQPLPYEAGLMVVACFWSFLSIGLVHSYYQKN